MGSECSHLFAIPVTQSDYSRTKIVVSLVFWPARLRRLSCLRHRWRKKGIKFASNKTSRGLCAKRDRKACMYCWAGQNGRCQIVVSQPPSLCYRYVTGQLQCFQKIKVKWRDKLLWFHLQFLFCFPLRLHRVVSIKGRYCSFIVFDWLAAGTSHVQKGHHSDDVNN